MLYCSLSHPVKSVDALRNLRELYVAITRARRRVIILAKKNLKFMARFFEELGCDLEWGEASIVMREFDTKTSHEDWYKEGLKYFLQENYPIAKSCFNAANNNAWSTWAEGKQFVVTGRMQAAKSALRTSSFSFFESCDYEHCLDVMRDIADIEPWNEQDNGLLDAALKQRPDHLPRLWIVKFLIKRRNFDQILIRDLNDSTMAGIFRDHRKEAWLKSKVSECDEGDRASVALCLPAVVGDYYMEKKQYSTATRYFLKAKNEEKSAIKASESAITEVKQGKGDILDVVESWQRYGHLPNRRIQDLVFLFEKTKDASETSAEKMMETFGSHIVEQAVEHAMKRSGVEKTLLHSFDRNAFEEIVEKALKEKFDEDLLRIVEWYLDHRDRIHAQNIVEGNLRSFSDEELLQTIMGKYFLRPQGLVQEIKQRGILVDAVRLYLNPESFDLALAEEMSNEALLSVNAAIENANNLVDVWRPIKNDPRVKTAMMPKQNSPIVLLLNLFDDPKVSFPSPFYRDDNFNVKILLKPHALSKNYRRLASALEKFA